MAEHYDRSKRLVDRVKGNADEEVNRDKCGPITLRALFFLAFALLRRLTLSKQPEDAIYTAKYLRLGCDDDGDRATKKQQD